MSQKFSLPTLGILSIGGGGVEDGSVHLKSKVLREKFHREVGGSDIRNVKAGKIQNFSKKFLLHVRCFT